MFFGVRYALTEAEIEALELRTDVRIKLCRRFDLDHWWGRFAKANDSEGDFLWVGTILARIGYEDSYEVQVSPERLAKLVSDVTTKLREAGIKEEPVLWIQFETDH